VGRFLRALSIEGRGLRVETLTSIKIIDLKPRTIKSVSLNRVAAAHESGNRVLRFSLIFSRDNEIIYCIAT
jgi:hypothetical protein